MMNTIKDYLEKRYHYKINDKAMQKMKIADDWYSSVKLPFHKRVNINGADYDLEQTNFTKRLCADDANLCEAIEIIAQESEAENESILDVLKSNNFNVMYRKQLEKMSAMGTVGCYLSVKDADVMPNGDLKNGTPHLNYVDGENILILSCDNDVITDVAFMGESYDIEGSKSAVVAFVQVNGKYVCRTAYFNSDGVLIKETSIVMGEVKPFAIMRVAEVNNLKDMKGYGLPKIFNCIAELKILDLTYNMWLRDLDKSDKLVLLNKKLCKYNSQTKKYELPNDEMKKIFVTLQDTDDSQQGNYQEYNPTVRIDDVQRSLELVLSMLSLRFGFGTKKYRFEEGRIVTATEYVGSKQDEMQELNKQRQESKRYIEDIIMFVRWYFSAFENRVMADDDILITFDDSFVVDKEKELESIRNDALSFEIPQIKRIYLQKKYNLTDEEVEEWMRAEQVRNDGTEDEE